MNSRKCKQMCTCAHTHAFGEGEGLLPLSDFQKIYDPKKAKNCYPTLLVHFVLEGSRTLQKVTSRSWGQAEILS